MEKLLRPKDRILLSLAFLYDLFDQVSGLLVVAQRGIYASLPEKYKRVNLYATLYRSLDTGEIEKIVKNGKAYYQLTSIGKKRLKRKFPLLSLQQKKWDGLWRVVIFDIKENKKNIRDALRSKLQELGFGMWQKSVYITPFNVAEDVRDFVVVNGLKDEVCVLVSEELYAGDIKKLANKIWKLDKINDEYKDLMESWEWAKERFSKEKIKKQARKCYSQYIELISKDPHLPKELLSADWWGEDVRKLVKEWLECLD